MTKTRLLSAVALVLLLANLVMVSRMYLERRHPTAHHGAPPHGGPRNIIIDRLRLDQAQTEAYDRLIEGHRASIRRLDHEMLEARSALYTGLGGSVPTDSLMGRIAALQLEVERTHVMHFADIRALCRADQLPLFDSMTHDLAGYFGPHRPPRR